MPRDFARFSGGSGDNSRGHELSRGSEESRPPLVEVVAVALLDAEDEAADMLRLESACVVVV